MNQKSFFNLLGFYSSVASGEKNHWLFHELGGTAENLLGKWFNVDYSMLRAPPCVTAAGDRFEKKGKFNKKMAWPFQFKWRHSLLLPCPSTSSHLGFNRAGIEYANRKKRPQPPFKKKSVWYTWENSWKTFLTNSLCHQLPDKGQIFQTLHLQRGFNQTL